MVGFNNPWYAEMIERFSPEVYDKDPAVEKGLCLLARCLLASSCILAEAIDGLALSVSGDECGNVKNLADEIRSGLDAGFEKIAEAIKEGHQEP